MGSGTIRHFESLSSFYILHHQLSSLPLTLFKEKNIKEEKEETTTFLKFETNINIMSERRGCKHPLLKMVNVKEKEKLCLVF